MALSGARGCLAALSGIVALGCSKADPPPRRTEPWLANPSAAPSAVAAPRVYRFGSDSSATFSVSGRKGKLSGRVPVTRGELRLDPRDLKLTRASIELDLNQLEIETPAPDGLELGASSTAALARQWLELGRDVPEERRNQFSMARFDLVSLDNSSAASLETSSKSTLRATAVGTLLVHGFRAPTRSEVRLSTNGPEQVSIQSVSALVLPLAPHDIVARDPAGVVDALGAARAADWVGKSVRIEFQLQGRSEPRAN